MKVSVRLIAGEKRDFLHVFTSLFADENELVDNTVLELRPEGLASVFLNKLSHNLTQMRWRI